MPVDDDAELVDTDRGDENDADDDVDEVTVVEDVEEDPEDNTDEVLELAGHPDVVQDGFVGLPPVGGLWVEAVTDAVTAPAVPPVAGDVTGAAKGAVTPPGPCGDTEITGESVTFNLPGIIIIGVFGSICWMLMVTSFSSGAAVDGRSEFIAWNRLLSSHS